MQQHWSIDFLTARRHGRGCSSGFSITELLMALVIVVILAGVAYPAWQGQVLRSRRTEAVTALLAMQQAQEKWRGNHAAYGTLAELAVPTATPSRYYVLDVQSPTASAYVLTAMAIGGQAADKACLVMTLSMRDGQSLMGSGPGMSNANDAATNRRCWNL